MKMYQTYCSNLDLIFFAGAVRFIRKIIGMRDEFYNRHVISMNLFAPIVETFVKNNARYNLLDSAILEIFEFIKTVRWQLTK